MSTSLHSLHSALLAGSVPLFLGALLNDMAYASSYEVQWKNFASWLLVGALVWSGFALLFSLLRLRHAGRRGTRPILSLMLLLAAWIAGFIGALVHAKDAWASMPEALVLSAAATALASTATWLEFSRLHVEQRP